MGTIYTLYKADKGESYELGKGQWFRIGQNEEYSIFRMDELWTVDTLTRFVRKALSLRGMDINTAAAKATAEHILAWAGQDRIVMVDETVEYRPVLKQLGLNIKGRRYKETGHRWQALPDEEAARQLTEQERKENAVLANEINKENSLGFFDFLKLFS